MNGVDEWGGACTLHEGIKNGQFIGWDWAFFARMSHRKAPNLKYRVGIKCLAGGDDGNFDSDLTSDFKC